MTSYGSTAAPECCYLRAGGIQRRKTGVLCGCECGVCVCDSCQVNVIIYPFFTNGDGI